MKLIIKLTIFLLLIFNINSYCQVSKFSISVNYDFMHYTPIGDNIFKVYNDYHYIFPISSGAEADLMYKLNKSISVGSGILYQQNRSSRINYGWKDWTELSIPLKVKFSTDTDKKVNFFLTSGIYFNNIIFINYFYYPHARSPRIYKILEKVQYDFFVEFGMEYKIINNLSLSISPVCKYRIPEDDISPIIYGFKFGVIYKI